MNVAAALLRCLLACTSFLPRKNLFGALNPNLKKLYFKLSLINCTSLILLYSVGKASLKLWRENEKEREREKAKKGGETSLETLCGQETNAPL